MRENSIIKANILQYLDFKGVSKYEFYQKTGVSNGVLSQKNGLSEENTMKFLSYYTDINPVWLLTGKGSMIKEPKNQLIKSVKVEDASENKLIDRLENDVLYLKQEIEKKDLIIEKKDEEIKRLNNLLIANESLQSSKTA